MRSKPEKYRKNFEAEKKVGWMQEMYRQMARNRAFSSILLFLMFFLSPSQIVSFLLRYVSVKYTGTTGC